MIACQSDTVACGKMVPVSNRGHTVNKQAIAQTIASALAQGRSKQDVYEEWHSQVGNNGQLAYQLAAAVTPARRQRHQAKNHTLIAVMMGFSLLSLGVGYQNGQLLGGQGGVWMALFSALVPAAFAVGFSRWLAAAFNVYILYALIQLPQLLSQLGQGGWAVVQLGMTVLTLVLTWHVRGQVFPDFTPMCMPRRDADGQFVFRD
jgi:hypothetical protein